MMDGLTVQTYFIIRLGNMLFVSKRHDVHQATIGTWGIFLSTINAIHDGSHIRALKKEGILDYKSKRWKTWF